MARAFTVAALALAEGRANAVGAVRLTCLEERLEIDLVRVGGYAAGFIPGAIAEAFRIEVPYTAIRGLSRQGRSLCLALDPAASAPHNRFSLARFTDDEAEALAGTYQARQQARLASWAAPLPLGVIVAAAAGPELVSGPLGVASLVAVVALGAWAALRWTVRALTWGGPVSDRLRDELERELALRMGFGAEGAERRSGAPNVQPGFVPAPEAPRQRPPQPAPGRPRSRREITARGLPAMLRDRLGARAARRAMLEAPAVPAQRATSAPPPVLPGGRALALAGAAALGVVAAIALLQRFSERGAPLPPVPEVARLAPAARAIDPSAIDLEAADPDLPRCLCQRADSPLWKDGLPVLSLLPSAGPEDGGHPMTPVDGEYDFDLAVVNNGATALRDVRVLLTFARRNARGERAGITERGLFWEGALRPGRAVKWHVSAPGTEVKVEPGVTAPLDDASGVASPDAFFELTRARYRSARIHAAVMLAYLRDPRALEALRLLGPAAPDEERTLARVRRASADVIACGIAGTGDRLRACVFNASAAPVRGAALREVPEGSSEPAEGARRWPIGAVIPVHDGLRLDLPLGEGGAPAELAVELPESPRSQD